MKDYNAENNWVVWFNIPVADLGRAQQFYESVLNIKIFRDKYNDFEFCVLELMINGRSVFYGIMAKMRMLRSLIIIK